MIPNCHEIFPHGKGDTKQKLFSQADPPLYVTSLILITNYIAAVEINTTLIGWNRTITEAFAILLKNVG